MKSRPIAMKCSKCGKVFTFGNTNGLPNGVSMTPKDSGRTITLCQACVIEVGKMDEADRDALFEELKNADD